MTDKTTSTDADTDYEPRFGPSRRAFLGTSALVGIGAIGATASIAAGDDHDDESEMEPAATVTFEDQTTDGMTVVVAEAMLSEGGFITVHDSTLLDGEVFGSVIGVSELLEAGDAADLEIPLFGDIPGADFDREMLAEDETLIAMPHFDSDGNGEYEFVSTEGDEDGPYVDDAGDPVVDDAMITVEDDEMEDEPAFSLQEIVDNPEGYYVDVHTAENPEGAVRGQLCGDSGQTEFAIDLTPDEVVDGGTDGASGTAELVLDPEDEVICFDLSFRDVTPPYESPANTATHIHEAEAGDAGPPVVVFPDPQPRDPDFDGTRTSSGCLPGELAFRTGIE
ncbi:CHRD domain-containing protein (plasmid) [Haloferacaceae archaeon DSL9]